jgi:hypothetical protein
MKYLTVVSLFLILSTLSAQTSIGLTIQGGEAWQNYGNDFAINGFDQRITHYGANVEVFKAINANIAIGAAPGFARRGAACEPGFIPSNGDFVFPGPSFDATIYLNYVELPFLVKGQARIWKKLSAYAQTGAGFSYLISGYREVTTFTFPTTTEHLDLDFNRDDSNLVRFDFGWHSGLGFAYPMGKKGAIQLFGKYYHSFMDMNENNTSLNRNWAVGLGYRRAVN